MLVFVWAWFCSFQSICSIICIILNFLLYRNLQHEKRRALHIRIKIWGTLSMLSFTLASLTYAIGNLLGSPNEPYTVATGAPHIRYIQLNLQIVNMITWSGGIFFLYCLFVLRITLVYTDTVFRVSRRNRIMLYSSLIVLLMLDIVHIYLLYASYLQFEFDVYARNGALIVIATQGLHLIISVCFVYIFSSKLLKMFILLSNDQIEESVVPSEYGAVSPSLLAFNHRQDKLLQIVIRQSLLSITAIISSQFAYISSVSSIFALSQLVSEKQYRTAIFIQENMVPFDCVVNCLCILMSFSVKPRLYNALCGKCDTCLRRLCLNYVEARLYSQVRRRQKENTMELDYVIELSQSKG